MTTIPVKPLTVNLAWQGKRFKSKFYKTFEDFCLLALPPKIDIPDGELEVTYEFGVSTRNFDVDNGIKPFQDVLQKKYGFNDARIMRLSAIKTIVPKGDEFIKFEIRGSDD